MPMERIRVDFRFLRNCVGLILAPLMLAFGLTYWASPSAAEIARVVPSPLVDETAPVASTEVAVLAGGCFWGVQGVFQHVDGVIAAISGYAGGARDTAHYQMVGSGTTGHAESVQITFDPHRITYGRILQIYFSVAPRPDRAQSPGAGYRLSISLSHLPANAGASSHRPGVYRTTQSGEGIFLANCYGSRTGQGVLPGGGLSPGLPDAPPGSGIYRDK
jgi:methionine-S-sulfoxide reductase